MTRRLATITAALALGLGVLVAAPAAASTPCAGSPSCDEVDYTYNLDAQFFAQVAYCFSSTNADIDYIDVTNHASDGQRHSYVLQVRVEQPENVALSSTTVYINWFDELNWQTGILSVPKSRKPYAYIRDGNGYVQRISAWHTEGDYPTWTKANRDFYDYGTYACI
ncbi:MAG TPA: hypothetical protein VGQ92_22415 [Actinoplanes sp.]|nr:hypothetical protein [Actinoplanes sp.]